MPDSPVAQLPISAGTVTAAPKPRAVLCGRGGLTATGSNSAQQFQTGTVTIREGSRTVMAGYTIKVQAPTYCSVIPDGTDQTLAIKNWLAAQPDGSSLDFGSKIGRQYRADGGVKLTLRNRLNIRNGFFYTDFIDPAGTIDAATAVAQMGNGTWTHSTQYRSRNHWWMQQCVDCHLENIEIRGPMLNVGNPPMNYGYHPQIEAQHGIQYTGCDHCTDHACKVSYIAGDQWICNAYNEGHESSGTTVPSTHINMDDAGNPITSAFHGEYNGRQGVTVANGNYIHLDGFVGGSRRSLLDLEPETSGDTYGPGGVSGQVDDHIDIGPLSCGWHANNMLNIAGGGDNYNIVLHDMTPAVITDGQPPADGSVGFGSGMGFPLHAAGPRRQGPLTLRNIGPFLTPIGHSPLYGGPAGIAQLTRVDGVTIDNYHVTGILGRDMVAVSVDDCTGLAITNVSCANGFDLAWNMTDATTAITVTGASLTGQVATLTVASGHGLVNGVNIAPNVSDARYNKASGVTISAVTATTISYPQVYTPGGIATDIPFASVTGDVNAGTFTAYDDGWTPPGGATVWDGFNQCTSGSTTRILRTDSGHLWDILFGPHNVASLTGNGTVCQSQSVALGAVVVPCGSGDGTVRITTTVLDSVQGSGPCFRATDQSNLWWFNNVDGTLRKIVAGVNTTVATTSAGANGDQIAVELAGSSVKVKRNGATLTTVTDAFQSTVANNGFLINNSLVSELDNFSFTP